MSKVIRIDDEVFAWLQSHATAFKDTPNSVLRRIAGLDPRVDPNLAPYGSKDLDYGSQEHPGPRWQMRRKRDER